MTREGEGAAEFGIADVLDPHCPRIIRGPGGGGDGGRRSRLGPGIRVCGKNIPAQMCPGRCLPSLGPRVGNPAVPTLSSTSLRPPAHSLSPRTLPREAKRVLPCGKTVNCELPNMVQEDAPKPAQCPPSRDVLRRRHKRRSRQHERFMARKAVLQDQGLLSSPPPPPAPTDAPPGSEAASSGRQHPGAASGGGGPKLTRLEASRPHPSKYVAIDCEMVGTGPRGRVSELARCSVVSYHGDVLYDKYIRPEMPIVDYRTRWSGITWQHMRKATPFHVAQKEILRLLKGKVVVGHALHNDFQALKYVHPRRQTRDTTLVPSLLSQPGLPSRGQASLKDLALRLLRKRIQVGRHGHSSVEDAATAMELYRLVEVQWEQQEANSVESPSDDAEPDSSTDVEQYMEDQYWPEDL
ncbi:apoptosis-enhancing nuclease [Ctenodactylus gundi]